MSPELRRLLLDGTARLGDTSGAPWTDFAVVGNAGPIPIPRSAVASEGWQADRGFNLLLTRNTRRPAYFAKCRDADDTAFARETELLERLGRPGVADTLVPRAVGMTGRGIRVQLSAFLTGVPLNGRLRALSREAWEDALMGIVAAADRLGRIAEGAVADLLPAAGALSPAEESRPALATLVSAGVAQRTLAALEAAMAATAPVPSRPQHGDLWASNALSEAGRWVLLDLEFYGLTRVPLYDATHLVKTTAQFRATPPDPWDAPRAPWSGILASSPDGAVCRRALPKAAQDSGLGTAAAVACTLFYLCDHAARLVTQRSPGFLVDPALVELDVFADTVRSGRAADLFGFAA